MSFQDFWADYPHPENRGSKTKALESWEQKLNELERLDALKALPLYRDYIKRTGAKAKMAVTWLNQKDWVGWLETLEKPSTFRQGMEEQKKRARSDAKNDHFKRDFEAEKHRTQEFWQRYGDENAVRAAIEARGLIYHGPRNDDPREDWPDEWS